MNSHIVSAYRQDLDNGLFDSIAQLKLIGDFVLYSFNIWTDPELGISEFSADTLENSSRVVATLEKWQREMAEKLKAIGRSSWIKKVSEPCTRNMNPAEFELKGIVRLEHDNWNLIPEDNVWDVIEESLLMIRDKAIPLLRTDLECDPDAEISIGTRRDWYDAAVPLLS